MADCRLSKHLFHHGYSYRPGAFLGSGHSDRQLPPQHQDTTSMATGALIFRWAPMPKVLLIRRAAADTMPDRWETPGGAVDDDESILDGLAREVKEETGLSVSVVVDAVGRSRIMKEAARLDGTCAVVPPGREPAWDAGACARRTWGDEAEQGLGQYFRVGHGRKVLKISFLVDVEEIPYEPAEGDEAHEVEVTLNPEEHSAFAWATEEELLGNERYRITTEEQRQVVLRGFCMAKNRPGRWKDSVWTDHWPPKNTVDGSLGWV